jgi:hypothetical protein
VVRPQIVCNGPFGVFTHAAFDVERGHEDCQSIHVCCDRGHEGRILIQGVRRPIGQSPSPHAAPDELGLGET